MGKYFKQAAQTGFANISMKNLVKHTKLGKQNLCNTSIYDTHMEKLVLF